MDVSDPALPYCKRAPCRLEVGEGAPKYAATVEDHYRRIYFDLFACCYPGKVLGRKRFKYIQKLESVLVESSPSEETIRDITEFYGPDLHQECLKPQLSVLHSHKSQNNLQSVVSQLKSMNNVEREFYF